MLLCILSILLALSFSVLKGLGVHNQLEPILLGLLEPLGDKRFDIVSQLIGFVDNVKVGVLGTVGFLVLLYSVVAMLQKILTGGLGLGSVMLLSNYVKKQLFNAIIFCI